MLNTKLKKKQAEILDYYEKFQEKKKYSPALSNVADHFSRSVPTIFQHVDYLNRKGYLVKQKGKKYSIRVLKTMAEIVTNTAHEEIKPEIQVAKYAELPLNKIICGDAVEVMKKFPSNSVDIVITSPPYDAVRDYKGFALDLHATGREVNRVLKDGGVAVMVIQDQTKNFGKSLTSFRTIIDWCDSFGFKLFETVIYRKYGAEGAWWNKRFRVDHEYIPVFLKGERPRHFNKEHLKIPSKHGGKTMTGGGTRLTNGIRIATRSIKINPMKCRGTIWEYLTAGDGSRLKHEHPATFPDQLPYDFISCFTPKNGIVLDPFVGSGTTAVAAKNLGYKYIGIDIAADYCAIAEKRMKEECALSSQNKLLKRTPPPSIVYSILFLLIIAREIGF